jgi:hypothetical protein
MQGGVSSSPNRVSWYDAAPGGSPMDNDQRREARYAFQLPAVLWRGKRALDVVTEDVSFRGLFLRVNAPPAVRQLVEIEMVLPPDNKRVRVHGMVVYLIRAADGDEHAPGIGIELRGLSGVAHAAWEAFVRDVQEQSRKKPSARPKLTGVAQRGSGRRRAEPEAPLLSVDEEEVSEETVEAWEDEEPTNVQPLPEKGGRKN